MGKSVEKISLSVGELADICQTGDINYRFSSRSSAREGIAAHKKIQKTRPDGYFSEHSVAYQVKCGCFGISINGRVDGFSMSDDIMLVDEIKSIRVNPEVIPEYVLEQFWRQACFYAFMLASEMDAAEVLVRLCLFHLDEEQEYQLEQLFSVGELTVKFAEAIFVLVDRLESRRQWRQIRSKANKTLSFPYPNYRPGQRELAVNVYRQLVTSGQLVLQAPTGIGKTIGTLFPALHALEKTGKRRIFYLSAKTSTQQMAEKAVEQLSEVGARIRFVTLTAKEKICFNPGLPCDPDYCNYAKGYHDRVNLAVREMLDLQDHFDRDSIERFAKHYEICPFELGLDISQEADLIICDYNYVFDPAVYLRRYLKSQSFESIALIDEVHNLVDRGREMHSVELVSSQFLRFARLIRSRSSALANVGKIVSRALLKLSREDDLFVTGDFFLLSEPPEALTSLLHKFCTQVEATLLHNDSGAEAPGDSLSLYFEVLRFLRIAEDYDADYVTLLQRAGNSEVRVKLYCVDPSNRLAIAFDRLSGVVCFSATLQPTRYFKALLGIDNSAHWQELPNPYPREKLHVAMATYVDTSFSGRESSIEALIELIDAVISSRPGGYLVFFPSYSYLDATYETFAAKYPDTPVVTQKPKMTDKERQEFLEHFDGDVVCGFAVMGGIFGEGVDLKGRRLIGTIIIGVGLPGLSVDRDLIRDRYAEDGFKFAYQYPGFTRVLQAAGRVIRSEKDEGVVCLVDSRYAEIGYQKLFPSQWQPHKVLSATSLRQSLADFWVGR